MKLSIFVVLITAGLAATVFAQPPDTLWTQTFGGSSGEGGECVQQTTDGGYIITGYTESYGAGVDDVYLIKTDASGMEQWSQTFGGVDNDRGYSVGQTSDGGYIITGDTGSPSTGGYDIYLIKADGSGTEQWSQTFGGTDYDRSRSVQQVSDGGYIIAGHTWSFGAGYYDVFLIKTDASGNDQWSRTFGGSGHDYGQSIQQTSDGGYIIAGYTESFGAGNNDVYLIKTDASGTEQWSQTFGESYDDAGFSVQQTTDGGYIITGFTEASSQDSRDAWLIKTDASGTEQWSQTFGGSYGDAGHSVQQTTDGGYIITGYTQPDSPYSRDVRLIKTDASGTEQWSHIFGGNNDDVGHSVQQTSNGGYIIAGYTFSYGAGDGDVWLIRVDEDMGVLPGNGVTPSAFILFNVFPNPFNPSTNISFDLPVASEVELNVFDINGRQIASHQPLATSHQYNPGHHTIPFDGSGLPSGIYFYRLTTGDFTGMGKMVLLK